MSADVPSAVEPTEPPRRRKDAERNRRRILAGAREVFGARGVAATLNDIAHHTGVGVGTVYRHFSDKEELIDALFADMGDTVVGYLHAAQDEPDAWTGFTRALEQVCELQAFDRGLREVMLGTGRGPERQKQMRERVAPLVEELVARAQAQGTLRTDVETPDFALMQLMLGALSDHTGRPELWRRYLYLLFDGLRARPGNARLPELGWSTDELQQVLLHSVEKNTLEKSPRPAAEDADTGAGADA